mmetsp:Transcript_52648/g.118600  ORF Transcript_52648/g.118600 Transcript_52648/m.118600 type:complete len:203 (-) Transcript_52648:75-683(-)
MPPVIGTVEEMRLAMSGGGLTAEDKAHIERLPALYSAAVDSCQAVLAAELFTEDGVLSGFSPKPVEGRAAIADQFALRDRGIRNGKNPLRCRHIMSNLAYRPEGSGMVVGQVVLTLYRNPESPNVPEDGTGTRPSDALHGPALVGGYSFRATNREDGVWKFSHWRFNSPAFERSIKVTRVVNGKTRHFGPTSSVPDTPTAKL